MADQSRQDAKSHSQATDDIEEIEQAFIAARQQGESLATWLERYPQHAIALIDLASALDAYDSAPEPDAQAVAATTRLLRTTLTQVAGPPVPPPAPGLIARGRGRGMNIAQFARELRLASDILIKLDRGVVFLTSTPRLLREQLATVLQCAPNVVDAALKPRPTTNAPLFYARQAPAAPQQQSFIEAVTQSVELSPEDHEFWLTVARKEGLDE